MDRPLEARLIGAAVLVAVAVLVVPELLTGRKSSEPAPIDVKGERSTRSVTIELGQSAGGIAESSAARPPAPVVAVEPPAGNALRDPGSTDRPVREPVQAKDAPTATAAREAKTAPTPAPVEPEPGPAAVPEPVSPPPAKPAPAVVEVAAPNRGGWAVQVGAFGAAASARKLVQDLEQAGYRAYVTSVRRSGKELHRVRVGPEADRAGAEQLAAKLAARGLPATVVAND